MERKTLWTYQDDKNKDILDFTFLLLCAWEHRPVTMRPPCLTRNTHHEVCISLAAVQAVAPAAHVAKPTPLGSHGRWMSPDRRDTHVGYFHPTCICPSPNIRENWVIHIWEFQRSLILSCLLHPLLQSPFLGETIILESAWGNFKLLLAKFIFAIRTDSNF